MENQTRPPSLRELQSWMRWIITDPRGVREALANPSPSIRPNIDRYTSPPKTALPWIADSPPIDKTERLDIYAEAYFTRVLESMKADFPVTARILGETSFQKIVSDYLKQHPSRSFQIGEIGRHFSAFAAGYEDLKSAEFLEAVIAMEWHLIESFYSEDSGLLESSKLSSLSDEDWETTEFILAPSAHLVEASWRLDHFWKLRDESFRLDPMKLERLHESQGYLIFRERGLVSLEPLLAPEYALLKKLKSRESLISALEKTQHEFPEKDIGSLVMNWFNSWIGRGIIFDLQMKKEMNHL